MPKVKVIQRKAQPHILHEFNLKHQHRLVLVQETGNEVSRWFEGHEIGHFNGFFFTSYQHDSTLRAGVFKQVGVEHRQLPAQGLPTLTAQASEARMPDKIIGANRAR